MLGQLLAQGFSMDWLLQALISVTIILFSLSWHEYAHGWMAYRLGDPTAYEAGRLTMRPTAHIDPLGFVMMLSGLIGWAKPVPFNPMRFRRDVNMKKGIVYVAAAGPLSNLLLSTIAYFLYACLLVLGFALGKTHPAFMQVLPAWYKTLVQLFHSMATINIFLAIFNSLPVPPLDGYKVFGAFLPNHTYYKMMRYERQIGMFFIFMLFFRPGLLNRLLNVIAQPFIYVLHRPIMYLAEQVVKLL